MLAPVLWIAGSLGPVYADGGVEVANAWVRFAPPSVKVHAAYIMLTNKSDKDLVLTGASSPAYDSVELHQSKMKDGVASMEKLDKVTIGAGKMVHLEPGGMHLMLFGPKRKQSLGAKVAFVLKFEGGKDVSVEAKVANAMGGDMKSMNHDHRGSH